MHATVRIPIKERINRRGLSEGLQEFYLGIGQFDEHDADTMFRKPLRLRHDSTKRFAVKHGGRFKVRNGNRDMVQSSPASFILNNADHHAGHRFLSPYFRNLVAYRATAQPREPFPGLSGAAGEENQA